MKWTRNQWAEFISTVGVIAAVGGYVVYARQSELRLPSEILFIAGGVLFLAGIVIGFGGIMKFFSRRSSQLGTNTTILALAVLVILGLLNFLSYKHHHRFDLTTEKLFTLSDQSKKVAGNLKEDVTIVRFAKNADPQLTDLIREYKNASPHIKFEDVDPNQKPDLAQEYGAQHMGDVIIAAGSKHQPIESSGFSENPEGGATYSEQNITTAILNVTRSEVKKMCFVTGHGEKSITDSEDQGYTQAAAQLKRETYVTDSVSLISSNGVPSDCTVLVIAGPTKPFFPQEVAMVQKYLDNGGRALIEVDPETDPKLDPILQAWNVKVGDNIVIDASGMGRLFGTGPEIPLVGGYRESYGDSPITKPLQNQMTFFPLARTVSTADKSKTDPSTVELLMTSPQSFTTPKLAREVSYNAKTDQKGPLSLAVAASKTNGDRSARLVVVGNSRFAENQVLGGAGSDGDLFLNILNWLAQDENLISIRPKTQTARHITLTEGQMASIQWLELFFLPGIVVIIGVGVWWKRR